MYQRLFGALLLVFTASRAFALFEEQAGENDWHSEYVGRATDIQLSGQDRLVMSTTSNVLSTHSLTSGNLLWRQILHQSDPLQSFATLSKPAAVVSLSNSSSLLRAWRSDDGTLLWEKRIQPSTQTMVPSLSTVPETTLGAGGGIAVVAGGHVQVPTICQCSLLISQKSAAMHTISIYVRTICTLDARHVPQNLQSMRLKIQMTLS